jgi:prepilin-type N-terminal cleavage/methylation domain-containing protein/prepilin-type processing-associated H-X9-DG protein
MSMSLNSLKRRIFSMNRKNAFTLIELLVVIAIIAILAAILFPVFAQAREKARAISCLSNTKNLGTAVMMYVQDYDEVLPARQHPFAPGGPQIYNILNPYIKNGDGWSRGGIWACPSAPKRGQSNQLGWNSTLFPDGRAPWQSAALQAAGGGPYISLAAIDRPADIAAVVDKGMALGSTDNWMEFTSDQWGFVDGSVLTGGNVDPAKDAGLPIARGGSSDGGALGPGVGDCDMAGGTMDWNWYRGCFLRPRYRHNGTTNVTFMDGHSKAVVRGQLRFSKNLWIESAHGGLW